jgi:hypothetical protein
MSGILQEKFQLSIQAIIRSVQTQTLGMCILLCFLIMLIMIMLSDCVYIRIILSDYLYIIIMLSDYADYDYAFSLCFLSMCM